MLCQKNLRINEDNKNINGDKFKFQGQSVKSQRRFGLAFGWIGEIFSGREPDFYKKIFQRNN